MPLRHFLPPLNRPVAFDTRQREIGVGDHRLWLGPWLGVHRNHGVLILTRVYVRSM